MSTDKRRRVQFRAPEDLIERADALAAVLDTSRTDVLTDALREYLRDAAHDDRIKQEIADAYYEGDLSEDELVALVGHQEAANFRVLKRQLDEEFIDEVADDLADS